MTDYQLYILKSLWKAGPTDVDRFDAGETDPFNTPQMDAVLQLGDLGMVEPCRGMTAVRVSELGLLHLLDVLLDQSETRAAA
jgi:hypothetical protein